MRRWATEDAGGRDNGWRGRSERCGGARVVDGASERWRAGAGLEGDEIGGRADCCADWTRWLAGYAVRRLALTLQQLGAVTVEGVVERERERRACCTRTHCCSPTHALTLHYYDGGGRRHERAGQRERVGTPNWWQRDAELGTRLQRAQSCLPAI